MLLNVLILALASYIPRFVPLVIFRKKIKSRFIRSVLFYIPYAVLAGLTFPAIFYSTGNAIMGIVGTAVALGLSLFKVNMALVALVCVLTVFGLGFIF